MKIWAAISKAKDAQFDELWPGLPLFFAGPSAGPAAARDDPRGLLMLLLWADTRPAKQIFLQASLPCPEVGQVVGFDDFDVAQVWCHNQAARIFL